MKFSIIIPVFNVAKELPRTIESLKAQTFGDYEIVLVDDGSTDGSGELVDAYSNIATVLHQKNQGVTVARRNGFGASKGDWILFVDGDDTIKLDTLSSINEAINCGIGGTDMVCFGFEVVYPHKRNLCRLPLIGEFSTNQLIDRMKTTPLEFIGSCIGNKCYRREIVDAVFTDVGNANISFNEDTLFAFSAFLRTKSISFLQGCFYEYIQRNGSARNRFNDRVVDEEEQFILSVKRLAKNPVLMIGALAIGGSVLFGTYKYMASSGKMGEAEAAKLENEFGEGGRGVVKGRSGFDRAWDDLVDSVGIGLGGHLRNHSTVANSMACDGIVGGLFWIFFYFQCFWFVCHRMPSSRRYATFLFLQIVAAGWNAFGSPFGGRHQYFVLLAFIALCRDDPMYGAGTVFGQEHWGSNFKRRIA